LHVTLSQNVDSRHEGVRTTACISDKRCKLTVSSFFMLISVFDCIELAHIVRQFQ